MGHNIQNTKSLRQNMGFHLTSSPKYPQSNGEAEWAVRPFRGLLKKSNDPYLAMLIYQSTPLQNGFSPAKLLMNCHLHTNLPM